MRVGSHQLQHVVDLDGDALSIDPDECSFVVAISFERFNYKMLVHLFHFGNVWAYMHDLLGFYSKFSQVLLNLLDRFSFFLLLGNQYVESSVLFMHVVLHIYQSFKIILKKKCKKK